jgi:hypothetical protein
MSAACSAAHLASSSCCFNSNNRFCSFFFSLSSSACRQQISRLNRNAHSTLLVLAFCFNWSLLRCCSCARLSCSSSSFSSCCKIRAISSSLCTLNVKTRATTDKRSYISALENNIAASLDIRKICALFFRLFERETRECVCEYVRVLMC